MKRKPGRPRVEGPTLTDMMRDALPGTCALCGDPTRRFSHGGFARYCTARECRVTGYQRLYKRQLRNLRMGRDDSL